MKLKAVVNKNCPPELIENLDNLHALVLKMVLQEHLKVKNFGPAEFYVQKCDFAQSEKSFCEVRLSGASMTDDRAPNDFRRSRDALERIYQGRIEKYLPKGKEMQLFVMIMLDTPLPNGSTLVEGEAKWIKGRA